MISDLGSSQNEQEDLRFGVDEEEAARTEELDVQELNYMTA